MKVKLKGCKEQLEQAIKYLELVNKMIEMDWERCNKCFNVLIKNFENDEKLEKEIETINTIIMEVNALKLHSRVIKTHLYNYLSNINQSLIKNGKSNKEHDELLLNEVEEIVLSFNNLIKEFEFFTNRIRQQENWMDSLLSEYYDNPIYYQGEEDDEEFDDLDDEYDEMYEEFEIEENINTDSNYRKQLIYENKVIDDEDLDYCMFNNIPVSVSVDGKPLGLVGVPEEYSRGYVKINGIFFMRNSSTLISSVKLNKE